MVSNEIDFKKIECCFDCRTFTKESFARKIQTESKKTTVLSVNDFLYDVMEVVVSLYVYDENNHRISEGSYNFAYYYTGIGYVKYSEFVCELESLGYDISLKTFDDVIDNWFNYRRFPDFSIDFSKQKEHKR